MIKCFYTKNEIRWVNQTYTISALYCFTYYSLCFGISDPCISAWFLDDESDMFIQAFLNLISPIFVQKRGFRWSCLRWHHRGSIIDTVIRFHEVIGNVLKIIYVLLRNLFVKNIEILRPTLIPPFIVEIHIFWNVGRVFFHWTPP